MWDRVEFKRSAKSNFKRNYWPCVAVSILLVILTGGGSAASYRASTGDDGAEAWNYFSSDPQAALILGAVITALAVCAVIGLVVGLLVAGPYQVGASRFYMENRNGPVGFGTVKAGFNRRYGNMVLTQFLKNLFIVLWSLLFLIPGIVKTYAYFAVPYILAENPDLDHNRVLKLSKEMTRGYKGSIFVTQLSFILWGLLAAVTFGIVGIFYVNPYIHATDAEMYRFLRAQALESGIATAEELPGFGEPEPAAIPQDTPDF